MYTLNIYRGTLLYNNETQAVQDVWKDVVYIFGSGVLLNVQINSATFDMYADVLVDGENLIQAGVIATLTYAFLTVNNEPNSIAPYIWKQTGTIQKIEFKSSLRVRIKTGQDPMNGRAVYILDN